MIIRKKTNNYLLATATSSDRTYHRHTHTHIHRKQQPPLIDFNTTHILASEKLIQKFTLLVLLSCCGGLFLLLLSGVFDAMSSSSGAILVGYEGDYRCRYTPLVYRCYALAIIHRYIVVLSVGHPLQIYSFLHRNGLSLLSILHKNHIFTGGHC